MSENAKPTTVEVPGPSVPVAPSQVPLSAQRGPSIEYDTTTQATQSSQTLGEYVIATQDLYLPSLSGFGRGTRAHSAGEHVPAKNAKKYGWDKDGLTVPVTK